MDIPAPTADQGRDELGRPTAPLNWWRLLAVTAYWLAITVLWGAFTFSVIRAMGAYLSLGWQWRRAVRLRAASTERALNSSIGTL